MSTTYAPPSAFCDCIECAPPSAFCDCTECRARRDAMKWAPPKRHEPPKWYFGGVPVDRDALVNVPNRLHGVTINSEGEAV